MRVAPTDSTVGTYSKHKLEIMDGVKHKTEDGHRWGRGRRRTKPALTTMEAHLVATVGEFVGTFLFLYFSYAGNVMAASRAMASAPGGGMSSETVIFISLAYSLSLLVTVWAFYRISGGLFNPAVSVVSRGYVHGQN